MTGFWIVLFGGLAALLAAALRDRHTRQVATGKPAPAGPDSASSRNRSLPDAGGVRKPPTARVVSPLTPEAATELETLLSEENTSHFPVTSIDPRFRTHTNPDRFVAQRPLVLVCDAAPTSSREIAPVFELAHRHSRPLLIVAPQRETAELTDTLAVNHRMQILDVALLSPADGDVVGLAHTLQITPMSRAELQAGGVTVEQLGQPRTAVAEGELLHLVR